MRRLSPATLAAAGILLLPASLAPLINYSFVQMAAGSGTHYQIRTTGLPGPEEMLEWSEWQEGAGPTGPSSIEDHIDPAAVIVGYRRGTAHSGFTELTFYQGKYRLPDGRIELHHATGPEPLIGLNSFRATGWVAGSLGLAAACFTMLILGWWREPIQDASTASPEARVHRPWGTE